MRGYCRHAHHVRDHNETDSELNGVAMASARDLKKSETVDHKGAADHLHVSEGTLYNWVNTKKIRVIKMGRKNVYRVSDLNDFMDERIQEADPIG